MATVERTAEHRDLDNASYHEDTTHDSFSSLKLFDESPAKYYHTRISKRIPRKVDTDKQQLGSAMHTTLLEPEKDVIAVIPKEALSKDGKRCGGAWKDWLATIGGKIPLKVEQVDSIRWMRDSLWENPAAAELLENATDFEHSVFWTDRRGNRRKVRFDAVLPIDGMFVDLKSTCNPGVGWFKEVKRFQTHRQAAYYASGYRACYGGKGLPKHIVVGNEPPYDCYVWIIPDEALELGRKQNAASLARLAECRRTGNWLPPQHGRACTLYIPEWFYRDEV